MQSIRIDAVWMIITIYEQKPATVGKPPIYFFFFSTSSDNA